MPDHDADARVLSGETWRDFCRALERAGDTILRPGSPLDPFDRAEGFRYLSRLARVALESYLEFRRPDHESDLRFECAHEVAWCNRNRQPIPEIVAIVR